MREGGNPGPLSLTIEGLGWDTCAVGELDMWSGLTRPPKLEVHYRHPFLDPVTHQPTGTVLVEPVRPDVVPEIFLEPGIYSGLEGEYPGLQAVDGNAMRLWHYGNDRRPASLVCQMG